MINPRRLLSRRQAPSVHYPDNDRPTLVVHRKGDQWGVVMLHGGREIAFYLPDEARRHGASLIELANIAARPGECPQESCG